MAANNSTAWINLECPVNPYIRESITNFLFELGAAGIAEGEDIITAYFPPAADKNQLLAQLESYYASLQEIGLPVETTHIIHRTIQDRDWNTEWKKNLQPFFVTDDMMIKPSWHKKPTHAPKIVLEIDPEMAFGTGIHETTRMCLQLLEKHIKKNATVLDIGTGTGILAIAAIKLGARKVVAFDNDPIAVSTACKNASKNGTLGRTLLYTGDSPVLKSNFSLIVANINRKIILKLLPLMKEMLDYNTILILSGILDKEEGKIRSACQEQKMLIIDADHQGEWLAFVLKKQPGANVGKN
ncbi:50S ribosomal protein L11 methyltransferase [candidate division KSB1 bacterium]|nr:50S ribosomal protein L11 methyltransferase [candidate division KSB1 bacterium]